MSRSNSRNLQIATLWHFARLAAHSLRQLSFEFPCHSPLAWHPFPTHAHQPCPSRQRRTMAPLPLPSTLLICIFSLGHTPSHKGPLAPASCSGTAPLACAPTWQRHAGTESARISPAVCPLQAPGPLAPLCLTAHTPRPTGLQTSHGHPPSGRARLPWAFTLQAHEPHHRLHQRHSRPCARCNRPAPHLRTSAYVIKLFLRIEAAGYHKGNSRPAYKSLASSSLVGSTPPFLPLPARGCSAQASSAESHNADGIHSRKSRPEPVARTELEERKPMIIKKRLTIPKIKQLIN